MSVLGRVFGHKRYPRPEPTRDEVLAVDVARMVGTARERGDRRSEPEVVASLFVGAEVTAERHRDEALRRRAAAASVATLEWLVARVGEDEAARLLSASDGPVDEQGRTVREARGR